MTGKQIPAARNIHHRAPATARAHHHAILRALARSIASMHSNIGSARRNIRKKPLMISRSRLLVLFRFSTAAYPRNATTRVCKTTEIHNDLLPEELLYH